MATHLPGDPGPAPDGAKLLSTLATLVRTAARCGALEREAAGSLLGLEQRGREAAARLAAVEALLGSANRAVDVTASRSRYRAAVAPFAVAMRSRATELLAEAALTRSREEDEDRERVKEQVRRLGGLVRSALEELWLAAWLPTTGLRLTQRLTPEGNRLAACHRHPGRMVATFELDAAGLPAWKGPCRVGQIAPGLRIHLDREPGLLRRWRPRVLSLEGLVIGRAEVDRDGAWVGLRRRRDATSDDIVLEVARADLRTSATVTVLDPPRGREPTCRVVDAADLGAMDRLLAGLQRATAAAIPRRTRLLAVMLDDLDGLALPSAMPLLQRVVDVLAPSIRELARRSPCRDELVVKLPRGEGRRQEIYLRKWDLWEQLRDAPPGVQAMFEGLGVLPDRISGTHRVAGAGPAPEGSACSDAS